jgi:hypothetical protein
MQRDRLLIALDVGRKLGVAVGVPGTIPQSYTVTLGKPGAGLAAQAFNLIKLMDLLLSGGDPRDPDRWPRQKPFMVVKEAPLTLATLLKIGAGSIPSTVGFHLIVEAMCSGHGVRCENANVFTVTKHFLGSAKPEGRAARKAAIVRRCQVLGYFERTVDDDDRADACAVWSFASVTLARTPPNELHLYGEVA